MFGNYLPWHRLTTDDTDYTDVWQLPSVASVKSVVNNLLVLCDFAVQSDSAGIVPKTLSHSGELTPKRASGVL